MERARARSSALPIIPFVLGLVVLLAPADAAGKSFTTPLPAPGDLGVFAVDVTAKRGGPAPDIRIKVNAPKSVRSKLRVLAVTEVGGRTKRLKVFIINPASSSARSAGVSRIVEIEVNGVKVAIAAGIAQRVKDALAKLTPAQKRSICNAPAGRKGQERASALLGLAAREAPAVVDAIKAVLCRTPTEKHRDRLRRQGLTIPSHPAGSLTCGPLAGTPNEADCRWGGYSTSRLRLDTSGGDQPEACFSPSEGSSCEVRGPQVFYVFTSPQPSGQFFVRFANRQFSEINPMTLFGANGAGQFVDVIGSFDPK